MASSKWKNIEELSLILDKRKYVFWGASNWIEQTLRVLNKKPEFIIDTNPNNEGIIFEGLLVKRPDFNFLKENNFYIIITTGNYDSLCEELSKSNFEMGNDFCVSPMLEERSKKDNLLNFQGKICFASPQHLFKSESGGGLYELDLNNGLTKKVYTGKCRTVSKFKNNYALIDMLKGIQILDQNYSIIKEIQLPANTEPHGLFFDQEHETFFIGCPGNDCVYSMDVDFNITNEFRITNKYLTRKSDFHHINDVYSTNGSLFVSMFSISGNWPNQAYDGGIVEFDIKTGECFGNVWANLWMPHSITKYKGSLVLLDSMTGRLISSDNGINLKFPGFVRGLDFYENFAIVAVSSHRYPEKVKNFDFPIMMNSGIFLVDLKNSLFRLIETKVTETIHSVIFI